MPGFETSYSDFRDKITTMVKEVSDGKMKPDVFMQQFYLDLHMILIQHTMHLIREMTAAAAGGGPRKL